MAETWIGLRTRLTRDGAIVAGALAGGIGLVFSFAGKGLIPGRTLGDPLPLALSVGRITQGFTYFDWRSPLLHTLFAVLLGVLAAMTTWLVSRGPRSRDSARLAGRIAAIINVGAVALTQVDALVVALWYLMAGAMSFFLTSFVSAKTYGVWQRLAKG